MPACRAAPASPAAFASRPVGAHNPMRRGKPSPDGGGQPDATGKADKATPEDGGCGVRRVLHHLLAPLGRHGQPRLASLPQTKVVWPATWEAQLPRREAGWRQLVYPRIGQRGCEIRFANQDRQKPLGRRPRKQAIGVSTLLPRRSRLLFFRPLNWGGRVQDLLATPRVSAGGLVLAVLLLTPESCRLSHGPTQRSLAGATRIERPQMAGRSAENKPSVGTTSTAHPPS